VTRLRTSAARLCKPRWCARVRGPHQAISIRHCSTIYLVETAQRLRALFALFGANGGRAAPMQQYQLRRALVASVTVLLALCSLSLVHADETVSYTLRLGDDGVTYDLVKDGVPFATEVPTAHAENDTLTLKDGTISWFKQPALITIDNSNTTVLPASFRSRIAAFPQARLLSSRVCDVICCKRCWRIASTVYTPCSSRLCCTLQRLH